MLGLPGIEKNDGSSAEVNGQFYSRRCHYSKGKQSYELTLQVSSYCCLSFSLRIPRVQLSADYLPGEMIMNCS